MHPGELPLISVVHAINLLVVGAALLLLRDPARSDVQSVVGFSAYAVTIVATGPWAYLAKDATTPAPHPGRDGGDLRHPRTVEPVVAARQRGR